MGPQQGRSCRLPLNSSPPSMPSPSLPPLRPSLSPAPGTARTQRLVRGSNSSPARGQMQRKEPSTFSQGAAPHTLGSVRHSSTSVRSRREARRGRRSGPFPPPPAASADTGGPQSTYPGSAARPWRSHSPDRRCTGRSRAGCGRRHGHHTANRSCTHPHLQDAMHPLRRGARAVVPGCLSPGPPLSNVKLTRM